MTIGAKCPARVGHDLVFRRLTLYARGNPHVSRFLGAVVRLKPETLKYHYSIVAVGGFSNSEITFNRRHSFDYIQSTHHLAGETGGHRREHDSLGRVAVNNNRCAHIWRVS